MRWYCYLILCIVLLAAANCTRLEAAPAPTSPPPKEITTEALTGYTVVSLDGTEIGPVDGVVLSAETGNTQYVIVFLEDIYHYGKGALNGPQDHYLTIPWTHLKLDTAHRQLVVDADANFVKNAPVLTEPPDTTVAGWDTLIVLYWTE
jgi:sporulation protein YlmC with PRC-barrel domain